MKRDVAALLVCGLAAAALLVPQIGYQPDPMLFPAPDGPEYLAGAIGMATSGDYSLPIAGERLPPRYPPGYSALLVPALWLGCPASHVAFATNGVAALLLLALVVGACWRREPVAGSLAALLLATTPAFAILVRSPMADLWSMLAVTAAVLALLAYGRGSCRAIVGMLGSGLLGLAICLRLGNALFAPLLLFAWWARPQRNWRDAGGFLLAFALGIAPQLVWSWHCFGHPLQSGYGFWLPDRQGFGDAFAFANVWPNLRQLLRELLQLEWKSTLASHYGHGSYFGPALVVGIALAAWWRPPRGASAALACGLVAYALLMLGYFFPDARFWLPLLPAAVLLLSARATAAWRTGGVARAISVGVLALHVSGVPGSQRFADAPWTFAAGAGALAQPYDTRAATWLDALRRAPPGLLLCSCNPALAGAWLGSTWTVAPAQDDHDYRFHPAVFRYDAARRAADIERMLGAGRPVYLLAEFAFAQLTAAADLDWRVLHREGDGGVAVATARR
jgi:hypothetical protein